MIYLEKNAAHICHVSATINHSKSVNQPAKYLWVGCGEEKGGGGEGGGEDSEDDDRLLYGVPLLLTSLEVLKLLQGPHLRHRQLPKKGNIKLG